MVELFARLLELGFKVANLFQSAPTRDYIGGVDGETEKAEKAKERERGSGRELCLCFIVNGDERQRQAKVLQN